MIFIKNKTQVALVDPLKFVTVSFATIMPNNWAVGEAGKKKGIIQAYEMRCLWRFNTCSCLLTLRISSDICSSKLRSI